MTVTETEGATVMETVTEATVEDVMVTGIEDLTDAGHLVSIRHTLLKTFLKLFSSTFKDYLDSFNFSRSFFGTFSKLLPFLAKKSTEICFTRITEYGRPM